jgi:hypothetical protein
MAIVCHNNSRESTTILCNVWLQLQCKSASSHCKSTASVKSQGGTSDLTSDDRQTWSPDNGNHSNPEGAGARILKGLRPDLVLIQEFNTSMPPRQWVNATFGPGFSFTREEGAGIPNGVISRHPIAAAGEWDDPLLDNRDFAWARIRLPNGKDLWAVSVHLHSKQAENRRLQAELLVARAREKIPPEDLVLLGGDLNTRQADEPCLRVLGGAWVLPRELPADTAGDHDTNAPRNRPYDWVLADRELEVCAVPVRVAGLVFRGGLVFDSRSFPRLDAVPPVRAGDSGFKQMQHMAVVRDFLVP